MSGARTTTGYNLFCKELSAEEGVKQLASRQRFVEYAKRWAALTPECRSKFKRRAAQHNTVLSQQQKQRKWNRCVKKMLKIMDEMQSLKPTAGYFVLRPKDGPPRYGGTPYGNSFISNQYETVVTGFCTGLDTQATSKKTVTINDIRQLFNSKYAAEAVGHPGKLPYKRLGEIQMEGLPEGIPLKKPQCYGTAQLRKIWNARENIRCNINAQQ